MLTVTPTKTTVFSGLETATCLKLKRVFRRQVVPPLTPDRVNQLQTSFEQKTTLLRAKNAKLSNQDCLESKENAAMASATTLNDACDCNYNGLTFTEFTPLRKLCQRRDSPTSGALTAALQALGLYGSLQS